jgi:hypothetical protein
MSSSMTDPQRFAVYQFLNDNADNEAPRNKGARIVAEQIHETTGYKLNPKTVYHMICAFGLQKHYLTRTLPTRQKQPEQAEQTEQQDLLAEDLGERVKTMEASMSTLFKVSQRLDAELAEVRKSLSNHKTNTEALGLAVRAITKHLSANGFSLKAAGYHYYGLPTDRGNPEYIINMLREGASERKTAPPV